MFQTYEDMLKYINLLSKEKQKELKDLLSLDEINFKNLKEGYLILSTEKIKSLSHFLQVEFSFLKNIIKNSYSNFLQLNFILQ